MIKLPKRPAVLSGFCVAEYFSAEKTGQQNSAKPGECLRNTAVKGKKQAVTKLSLIKFLLLPC